MIEMEAGYKGYVIRWDDHRRSFSIHNGGERVKEGVADLEACEKWIDGKTKQVFNRVASLLPGSYGRGATLGEATSAIDSEYLWFVSRKGDRSKQRFSFVWLDTPENRENLKTIANREAEIEKLRVEIKIIQDSAERLTIEKMIPGDTERAV